MTDFIRSTAKAIIVKDGKVLLNRSIGERIGEYYSLPGGGQHRFEPLEDAVRRECLEETGLHVRVLRLAAVCEEIWDSPEMREAHPKYCHRMLQIFLCEIDERYPQETAMELDYQMVEAVWVPISKVDELPLEPRPLTNQLSAVLNGTAPLFLGTVYC